ncbi:MAG: MMPL family transporter, partial [Chromatiaceae bacterium]|nr:MMPL family transporter [Chromatiaceae bacterium]
MFVVSLSVTLSVGVLRLGFSNDYQVYFSSDNPQLQAFESLQDTFAKNDNILFVVTPRDKDVFSKESLTALLALTTAAWQVPYSIRVDSVANFQHSYARGDELVVGNLVPEPEQLTPEALARIRRVALQDPLLVGRLVSKTGDVAGVNVTLQLPAVEPDEVEQAAQAARRIAAEIISKYPEVDIRLTGVVVMNDAFSGAAIEDAKTLYPLMFVAIFVALGLLLRSTSGTLTALLVVVLSITSTMGLAGWLGVSLSQATVPVPIVIMTLAIADSVHILVSYLRRLQGGGTKRNAMTRSLKQNLRPVFLTSFTTVIGFLSLNFSEAPPFRDLGNLLAIGVVVAFLLSVTLAPTAMMLLPAPPSGTVTLGSRRMQRLGAWVVEHRTFLFWSMLCLVVFLMLQLPRNRLNEQYVEYFDRTTEFRRATDYTVEHLTGIYSIEYSLSAGAPGGIYEPQFLHELDQFANWYRRQPGVRHVSVITDVLKKLNKNMNADDPASYRLPATREHAAQYLLVFELSLPAGLDLNSQINVDRSATRLTVTMDYLTTAEVLRLERDAFAWIRDHAPSMNAVAASPAIMFSHIAERNIRAMLEGTALALLLISATLIIGFRSFRIGLLSTIPNLIPMAMAFGLWGLVDGQIGLAVSVVSAMTLGIVVDDTVHFLNRYTNARANGAPAKEAVLDVFATVGTAIWVTSAVLILGFSMLILSHFEVNGDMGFVTALT